MTIRTLSLSAALLLAASATQAVAAQPQATMLDTLVVTPTAQYTMPQWQQRQAARHAVVLDRVVVTPTANYTLAQWQARSAAKNTLAAVMLEPVIVTPSGSYTVAQWQQRRAGLAYVAQQPEPRGVKRWLKMVWKHFQFTGTQVEV